MESLKRPANDAQRSYENSERSAQSLVREARTRERVGKSGMKPQMSERVLELQREIDGMELWSQQHTVVVGNN